MKYLNVREKSLNVWEKCVNDYGDRSEKLISRKDRKVLAQRPQIKNVYNLHFAYFAIHLRALREPFLSLFLFWSHYRQALFIHEPLKFFQIVGQVHLCKKLAGFINIFMAGQSVYFPALSA